MKICPNCKTNNNDSFCHCVECGCNLQNIQPVTPNYNNGYAYPKKETNFSVASLVLGIIGLVTSLFIIGIVPAFIGFIFGVVALVNKEKGKTKAIIGIICSAISIIVFGLFIMSPSETSESQKAETISVNQEEQGEILVQDEEETVENKEEETNFLTVGNSIEYYGLVITLNDASDNFTDYEDEYGWDELPEGMKYVMADFTFENNGDGDEYATIYDFECYADGTLCEQNFGLDENDNDGGKISPGRNVSFRVYFYVPIDSESIEIEYELNSWTEEKAIIKIK